MAVAASGVVAARTWDDLESLMYDNEPANFLLEGECAAPLVGAAFPFPSARDVVDLLRRDPDTRIVPGRPPVKSNSAESCNPAHTTPGELSILETRCGAHHFGDAIKDEVCTSRQAPQPTSTRSTHLLLA